MNARKGLSSTMKIGGMLVIALILVAGMVAVAALYMQGSIADDGSQDSASEDDGEATDDAPWAQRPVKVDLEVFMEGSRKGVRDREYTLMDMFGAIIGFGVVILGLGGLVGNLTGYPVVGLPNWAKGGVLMLLPVLLLRELFSA